MSKSGVFRGLDVVEGFLAALPIMYHCDIGGQLGDSSFLFKADSFLQFLPESHVITITMESRLTQYFLC